MDLTIDLNLMRTFVVVYRARSITRAAKILHLSQPAVSHALRRLRHHFEDPLFVRTRTGVAPTRLAASIYAEVNGPLSQVAASTEDRTRFDPATSTRRFRLALTDLGEAGLLPVSFRRPEAQARGFRWRRSHSTSRPWRRMCSPDMWMQRSAAPCARTRGAGGALP
ncbi:LysR family transcriptional regulator [Nesterenkonia pannonica]|uniref:LysR family transcriptional regulator n=1 Tax=Nesterenkonia pannonica TaxID=1548602 RepID=UPI0021645EDC|nr:LysR family transcriptional regulator [Nesterenkonia pannonica]